MRTFPTRRVAFAFLSDLSPDIGACVVLGWAWNIVRDEHFMPRYITQFHRVLRVTAFYQKFSKVDTSKTMDLDNNAKYWATWIQCFGNFFNRLDRLWAIIKLVYT